MKNSLLTKWVWFVALWVASVIVLGIVAYAIKLVI
jgi:hypothetical protein